MNSWVRQQASRSRRRAAAEQHRFDRFVNVGSDEDGEDDPDTSSASAVGTTRVAKP